MTERRSHDIPLTRRDVAAALDGYLSAHGVSEREREAFRAFARLIEATFHFELHQELEDLKACYEHFDPDRRERRLPGAVALEGAGLAALAARVAERLTVLLERGNYRRLSQPELDRALTARSLFPVDVTIDFSVFDEVLVFVRGEVTVAERLRLWHGLRRRTILVPSYERVCLFLRLKPAAELTARQRKSLGYAPGTTVLKLFRNIPKADVEMLFPNTQLRMRTTDKLVIGVPAVLGGVPVMAKLAPALFALAILVGLERGQVDEVSIIAGLSGLTGLGLFLFRQWDKFKSRKLVFMKMLSESLYFRNLDNNEGVLTRLVDEAEEEECKEVLVAYALLRCHPGATAPQLDERAERWFADELDCPIDFEVDDALGKLQRLDLVRSVDERGYTVIELDEALRRLDQRWDALFPYHGGNVG